MDADEDDLAGVDFLVLFFFLGVLLPAAVLLEAGAAVAVAGLFDGSGEAANVVLLLSCAGFILSSPSLI